MSIPLVIKAGTIGALLVTTSNEKQGLRVADPQAWSWPVAPWRGIRPTISDGWGSGRDGGARLHRGVDIMYQRDNHNPAPQFRPGTHDASKGFYAPPGTPIYAAHDGMVWSTGQTARGYSIVIDHGPPWATFYQHLESIAVTATKHGQSKQHVSRGQLIGIMGYSHTDGEQLRHLHFEIWHGGARLPAVDPAPIMRDWQHLPSWGL